MNWSHALCRACITWLLLPHKPLQTWAFRATNHFSWFYYEGLNSSSPGYSQLAAQLGQAGLGWSPHVSDNPLGWGSGGNWATCLSLACFTWRWSQDPKSTKTEPSPIYKRPSSFWFCCVCCCFIGWSKWQGSTQSQCGWVGRQGENYDHFANNPLTESEKVARDRNSAVIGTKKICLVCETENAKFGLIQALIIFTRKLFLTFLTLPSSLMASFSGSSIKRAKNPLPLPFTSLLRNQLSSVLNILVTCQSLNWSLWKEGCLSLLARLGLHGVLPTHTDWEQGRDCFFKGKECC